MPKVSTCQLILINYFDIDEVDEHFINDYGSIFKQAKYEENTELATTNTTLPMYLYSRFEVLTKYYLFKYAYHYSNNQPVKSLDELSYSDKVLSSFKMLGENAQNICSSFFILESQIIKDIVNDIKYFNEINLIKDKDVLLLKEELYHFLDYIEVLAVKGHYENGNKVSFYISDIYIETGHGYICTPKVKISLIQTFMVNHTGSTDEKAFEKMKTWFQSMIRVSNLISVTGEKQRIKFFDTQRKILKSL